MIRSLSFWVIALIGLCAGMVGQNNTSARRSGGPALHWTEAKVFAAMPRLLGGGLSAVSWVDVIFEYADRSADTALAEALIPRVLFTSRMDRQWNVPARFSVLALPVCRESRAYPSYREILDSSLSRNPGDWRTRLFLAEQQSDCGVKHADLTALVLPLAECVSCPSWVRTYPVGFLGEILPPETRLSMLLETRAASFSNADRTRIDKRIREIIRISRASDGFSSEQFVEDLLGALDESAGGDAEAIRGQLVMMARPVLPPKLLGQLELLCATTGRITAPESGSSRSR